MSDRKKLSELAKSYLPKWNFSTVNPDGGSVVAMLYDNMLSDSEKRYDSILHKHKIQYLNMFDKLVDEPIEAAKSYVKFTPAYGVPEPVYIKKGTSLSADSPNANEPIIFETTHDITVTDATLDTIIGTQKATDKITQLYSGVENEFTAFSMLGENTTSHKLMLYFDSLFAKTDSLNFKLEIKTPTTENSDETALLLCSDKFHFALMQENQDGLCYEDFDNVSCEGNIITFVKKNYNAKVVKKDGKEYFGIVLTCLDVTRLVTISSIHMLCESDEVLPDAVYALRVGENVGHFLPFGKPMDIYAECGIACNNVLSKKGAQINVAFNLDFEVLTQDIAVPEEDIDYKVIMKKQPNPKKIPMTDIVADYVIWEYLTPNGFKRLIYEESVGSMFNGKAKGDISLEFTCPDDIVEAEGNNEYNLRMRLLRAENLYKIPSNQLCPVIENLRLSFTYEKKPQLPLIAVSVNNYDTNDITVNFAENHSVTLFFNTELDLPAMYFGFNKSPWGTPISLYLEIENNADYPVDFTVEYASKSGFSALKVVDNTNSMLYSGTILLLIPKDAAMKSLFGQEKFWLRFINHNKENHQYNLPLIKSFYLNMAQVINLNTKTEYFYIDNVDAQNLIRLSRQNILSAEVYVNEENDSPNDNWVLWEKSRFLGETGRVYDIDLTTGILIFEKNVFASIPIKENAQTVKVNFRAYQGFAANVQKGAINTINHAIKYIVGAENPLSAYGGYDGYSEQTAAAMIENLLRTRGRAVSEKDYADVILATCYGVKKVKCRMGLNLFGEEDENAVTIAVLIDDYEKGSHIFSAIKEQIRTKLLDCSNLAPLGKTLILSQPHFIKLSVRLWVTCDKMENAYDLQKETVENITRFIDPLTGNFDGNGFEIGVLPTAGQLMAFLKIRQSHIITTKMVMTARYGNMEFVVNDSIYSHIGNPFAMAVNGEHIVHISLE